MIVDYSVEDPFQNRQLVSHDGSGKRTTHVYFRINFRSYRTFMHVTLTSLSARSLLLSDTVIVTRYSLLDSNVARS